MNDNRINYLVVSEKPHESNYVFKYTIQTLKERVIKSEFLTKTLTILTDRIDNNKSIVIRFCSDYEYETKHLYALPGTKDLDGRWFEGKLDEYKAEAEAKLKELQNETN